MILLPRRSLLAIVVVVDVALHARPIPVSAKVLAARHNLPPRHLETVLQGLVRHGILKGTRGPRGGYELARERRRISVGEVARIALATDEGPGGAGPALPNSALVEAVIAPALAGAGAAFVAALDAITIEQLCLDADAKAIAGAQTMADFAI